MGKDCHVTPFSKPRCSLNPPGSPHPLPPPLRIHLTHAPALRSSPRQLEGEKRSFSVTLPRRIYLPPTPSLVKHLYKVSGPPPPLPKRGVTSFCLGLYLTLLSCMNLISPLFMSRFPQSLLYHSVLFSVSTSAWVFSLLSKNTYLMRISTPFVESLLLPPPFFFIEIFEE